eukprot:scaffold3110_cov341-Prasinococcus_capsulatus_cf.AAC.7
MGHATRSIRPHGGGCCGSSRRGGRGCCRTRGVHVWKHRVEMITRRSQLCVHGTRCVLRPVQSSQMRMHVLHVCTACHLRAHPSAEWGGWPAGVQVAQLGYATNAVAGEVAVDLAVGGRSAALAYAASPELVVGQVATHSRGPPPSGSLMVEAYRSAPQPDPGVEASAEKPQTVRSPHA